MTMLDTTFALPCGAQLHNRIAKAAMSEHLAEFDQSPGQLMARLYERWARGGTGVLITGNVMIDSSSLESKRNVVLEAGCDLEPYRAWAAAGASQGNHVWMQINHPGRQTPRNLNPEPVGPSAVDAVDLFRKVGAFAPPRALTHSEILSLVERYATTVELARDAGFTGVQVHGAHGYLVAQFLSPLTNVRTDDWGGSIDNRMRFLREILRAIRAKVGPSFPISVKLNSADFQRGGFSEDESMQVVQMLEEEGVDLVEVSGGNYESQAMFDAGRESSQVREAYFLDYARKVRRVSRVPLMVTGGFRSRSVMESALEEGALDVIGMARPLAAEPDLSAQLIAGASQGSQLQRRSFGLRSLDSISEGGFATLQINRMARGKEPRLAASAYGSTIVNLWYMLEDGLAHGRARRSAARRASA
jgi:2,4-dienoyl-CoA reductase-like NADH-dependent reductase (Old Yellow Enzyme family)